MCTEAQVHARLIPAQHQQQLVPGIRHALGLSSLCIYPELLLFSASGDLLCSDAAAAIACGSLQRNAMSRRVNVLPWQPATHISNASGIAMHPDTLVHAGFYPGDTSIIRVSPGGNTALVYLNASEAAHAVCTDAAQPTAGARWTSTEEPEPSTELGSLEPGVLYMPPLLVAQLGLRPHSQLVLERLDEPATARSVTVRVLGVPRASQAADMPAELHDVAAKALRAHWGCGTRQDEGAVAAALHELAATSHWLSDYVAMAACGRHPVVPGALVVIPGDASDSEGDTRWGLARPAAHKHTDAHTAVCDIAEQAAALDSAPWWALEVVHVEPRGSCVIAPGTSLTVEPVAALTTP